MSSQNHTHDLSIVIGRCEPPHLAHEAIFARALATSPDVAILLGSAGGPPTPDNPFTEIERMNMIRSALEHIPAKVGQRVFFCPVEDYQYNDAKWEQRVQGVVHDVSTITEAKSLALVGHIKDASSFYLKRFPQLDLVKLDNMAGISATDVRRVMFETLPTVADALLGSMVSTAVAEYVKGWRKLPIFESLCNAHTAMVEYNAQFASPYPKQHVTADAVAVCAGHILLVRRKDEPGKGLWALPGGFVGPNETCRTAAIRELREETTIRASDYTIGTWITGEKLFDSPKRSARKRTFTLAYLMEIPYNSLPEVVANDDAEEAHWFSFTEIARMRSKMFEDHFDICQHFTGIQEDTLPSIIGGVVKTANGWEPIPELTKSGSTVRFASYVIN